MNQELRQRIIGAIVVTALAAIFIPMLFDDPIDDSGQSVSELVIPEAQVNVVEEVASKLPGNAEEVAKTSDAAPESFANSAESTVMEENAEQPVNNQDMSTEPSDDVASIDNGEETDPLPRETEDDFQSEEPSSTSLDTGVVEKAKKPEKKPKPVPAVKNLQPATINKTEKPATKVVKSAPELQRWYIQAGSFSKKENALSLMETLKKQGLPVILETKDSLYRLKVGPELDKKRAIAMKAKLDKQNIKNILIAE
ncbi:MAG: SPOR domain-containing protein [Methylococcaceae bacterium]